MPLAEIIQAAESAVLNKQKPVLLFDIDDTLIDTRHRKMAILKELAEQPIAEGKHGYNELLKTASLKHIKYRVKDTLAALGIFDEGFVKDAESYWRERNFTNAYIEYDQPIAGAVRFVNWLHRKGSQIIYLTGRPEPTMGKGTKINLKQLEFPLGEDVLLMMKPDAGMPDFEYKQGVMAEIAQMGEIVAAFENEGHNLNLMAEHFPEAYMVMLDTIKSPGQPPLSDATYVIKDYI